jgi:hypothetical protein
MNPYEPKQSEDTQLDRIEKKLDSAISNSIMSGITIGVFCLIIICFL